MKCRSVAVMLVSLAPVAALADVISHNVPFDYNANDGITFPVLQGFDTLGGTRELRGVTFDFHHGFELEVFAESTGPTPVSAEDYSVSISYISLFQLGLAGGKQDPPFLGPGAFFLENASGDLGAFDGVPGNDGPDSFRRSYTDAFTITQVYGLEDQDVLDAVRDAGELTTVLGGFTEFFFGWFSDPNWPLPPGGFPEYPTDAALWVSTPSFRHFGSIDVTYEYVNVPGPAGAATIGVLCSLGALRRRRGGMR